MNPRKILLACHERGLRCYLKELLEESAYKVETANTEQAVIESIAQAPPDLLLLDMALGGANGLKVLERCKLARPEQKVVMISGGSEANDIVQAVKLGALEFVDKPSVPSRLQAALARVFAPAPDRGTRPSMSRTETDELVDDLDQDLFFLAASPVMKQIRAQVALVAKVDLPVLLLGESGVGKEIIARLIHKLSPRATAPFLKINCAALPAELLESELFGHEAGAFTGAAGSKPGKFELSNRGTVLLDEIGEMSPWLQPKILHVLQDGRYSRLGGQRDLSVDVRILAATNIDIETAIAAKRFRQDLYYRLNAFTVTVPPLRERREEIPLLLAHFMKSQAAKLRQPPVPVSERLTRACLSYHWPGNLRELVNIVKRYLVLGDEDLIIDDLNAGQSEFVPVTRNTRTPATVTSIDAAGANHFFDEAEFREIQKALENSQWDRKLAAALLKISPGELALKMKRYGLYPQRQNGWLRYG